MKSRVAWRLASLVLILAACSAPATAPSATLPAATPTPRPTPTPEFISAARFEPAPCPFVLPEGYVQGEDVDCGWLVVPENRAQLPSRAIRLAVGVFHPQGGVAQPDPIIYLSGGPGGSALEFSRYTFEDGFAWVLDAGRDLILFDQRGVGVSRPALDCPNVDALALDLSERVRAGHPASKQETGDLVLGAYLACGENLGRVADLATYNSAASAADVNDLRLALGYSKVNLWGVSYGTRLALTVMRDHPEGLRSVVLDSVYPPDVDLYVEAPANFNRSLNLLLDSCAANPVCDEAYPDLRAVFFDTVKRLDTAPTNGTAAPITRTITDTLTGQGYTTMFDGDALMGFVFQVLYETELKYMLPELIYDASQGDFDALDRIRGALLAQRAATSPGMMFSVQCHEEIPFSSPEAFDAALAQHPELAGLFQRAAAGGLAYRVCAGWGAGEADAVENQPVVSDVPALVMAGEFDPVTPPAWGRHAAETLSRSYFFEYPGVGHGASAHDCGREMMLAFWDYPPHAYPSPPAISPNWGMTFPLLDGYNIR